MSRREHSRLELGRKLGRYATDPDEIEAVLDKLEKEGWLSTNRFAQSLVHRLAPKQGTARIVQELRQHGVDAAELAHLRQGLQSSELERATEVWRKRFGELPADANARAKQIRFLMARGFTHAVIRQVLAGIDIDEADASFEE